MAVTYPNKLPILNDEEYSLERPVSTQAALKLIRACNMMQKLVPIGELKAMAVNNQGVKAPNGDLFQYCDGGEITNGLSPLRSTGLTQRYTPDMKDRFPRGADASTVLGSEAGGNATVDLSHTHTTGTNEPLRGSDGEEGDEQAPGVDHNHGVNSDLSSTEPLNPAHLKVVYYMKVS
jgi:hypothetical protein